jgi:hypothetical protein
MTQQIGWIRILQGRLDEAVAIEREALELSEELGYKDGFLRVTEMVAIVLARCGNASRGAELLGKLELLRDELEWLGWSFPLLEDAEAQIRSQLSEDALREAMDGGRSADVRELLQTALNDAETLVARRG